MVASEKGVVVGRLSFREDGDLIDCQRMGVGGKAIPPNVDKVSQQAVKCQGLPLIVRKEVTCTPATIRPTRESGSMLLQAGILKATSASESKPLQVKPTSSQVHSMVLRCVGG